jgi:hypothetical protein
VRAQALVAEFEILTGARRENIIQAERVVDADAKVAL